MRLGLHQKSLRIREESNRIGTEFLLADLDTGLTFVQVACVTGSQASRTRNLGKAFEVYRTVLHLIGRVESSPPERLEIERKLEDLRCRLEKAGISCNP